MKTANELITSANNIIANCEKTDALTIKHLLRDLNNVTQNLMVKSDLELVKKCKETRLKLKETTLDIVIKFNNKLQNGFDKKRKATEKAEKTREANKPENNITSPEGEVITISNLKDILFYLNKKNSYANRFLNDIKNKNKLTTKQHNYLSKLAIENGYFLKAKTVRKATKKKVVEVCNHEDLGSMGYTHGDTVECLFCGKMAEVW